MSVELVNLTIERFNSLFLHDSKLVGVSLFKVEEEDKAKISLELLDEDGTFTPAEIIFKDCVYFQIDSYLAAKSMCGDAISNAKCYGSSDWKIMVSEPSPYDPIRGGRGFEEHLHFSISMCPPGGTINVLAKDFSLQKTKA